MPAAAAMSSTVVRSNPCRPNSSNATCSSSPREVTRRRPALLLGSSILAPSAIILLRTPDRAPPDQTREHAMAAVQGTVTESEQPAAPLVAAPLVDAPSADAPLVEEELLVEEVSIDGMCGVY